MATFINAFEIFYSSIAVTGPIFMAVLTGAFLRAFNLITDKFVEKLSTVVYWFILPATLFFGSLKLDPNSDLTSPYLLAGVLVTLLTIILSYFYARWRKVPFQHIGIFVQGAYRSNLGLVGLSLTIQAFGETGLSIATLPVAIWTVTYNILAVVILNVTLNQKQSVTSILKSLIRNPLIIAIVLGALVSYSRVEIPPAILTSGSFLAKFCLLFALLSVGATLNLAHLRNNYREALEASIWKLLITPVISIAIALSMGISGMQLTIFFFLLSGPTATSSFLMVAAAGGNRELAADIVTLTTLTFPITITAGLLVLQATGI
ncbi:MAG: putative permease [Oceanicoccus sp.]|jgi:predicted permease